MAQVVAIPQGGQLIDASKVTEPIKANIRRAREAQKAHHPTWQSNLAFAAGQQWLVWAEKSRDLRSIQVMDPRYRDKELYTADIITENRLAILGEMGSDDDRPELLLRRDDQSAEDFQAQANRALGYGWDHEWHGDEALAEVDRLTIDLGTAAIRCRFDPTVGKVAYENVPHENGQPILDSKEALAKVAAAAMGQAPPLSFKDVPAGRITWQPISAFGLLPPTGVANERYFSFDCIVQPTLLSELKQQYPELAKELKEDADIGSTLGEATVGAPGSGADRNKNRLRGYVWLFTYFERPTQLNPKGRVFYFAGNDLKLLEVKPELPYVEPDGSYCAGISYFHWWRVTGRFFSRSLVEALKDGQRAKNKRRTQANEIIDRGMPKYFAQRGSQAQAKTNEVMERINMEPGEPAPTIFPGFGPGDWMYREDEQIDKDLRRSTGITEPTLGENPASVTNYSQLSLLREQSQVKRQVVYLERKLSIAKLVEFSLYDIRRYWGEQKQIMLAGEDDRMEAADFNATRIPEFFIVRVAKGAAKPRSQAGELQKIQDIWTAAVAVGATINAPDMWINWFKSSLEHGQPLDLPDSPADDQAQKAEFENHLMLQGIDREPRYWEPPEVHIPRHRQAQIQADEVGDVAAYDRIEAHIQATLQLQMQNAAALQGGGPPGQAPGIPAGIPPSGEAPGANGPPPTAAQPSAPAGP
jgi:hypothetical protein